MTNVKGKGDNITMEGEVFTFMGAGLGGRFEVASVQDEKGDTLDELLVKYDERKVRVTIEFLD